MKKIIFVFLLSVLSMTSYSQTSNDDSRSCVTIGILQGGGSLLGADIEFLLTEQFGFQLGAGLVGFGGALNYHLKPSIRSSFISINYWNQGIGDYFAQNMIGTTYVYRAKKWFTFQIGLGTPLDKGPAMSESFNQPSVMLLYSIGAYIPL